MAEGAVPVKTLGLPDEFQVDGWGRKFAYAVWTPMTGVGAFITYGIAQNCGGITVKTPAISTAAKRPITPSSTYGPDGYGGYTQSGTVYSTATTNADEQTNAIHLYDPAGIPTPPPTWSMTGRSRPPIRRTSTTTRCASASAGRCRTIMTAMCREIVGGTDCIPIGFRIDGQNNNVKLTEVEGIGDINGDGIPDLVMSSANGGGVTNTVYVIFGTATGWPIPPTGLDPTSLNGSNGFIFTAKTGRYFQLCFRRRPQRRRLCRHHRLQQQILFHPLRRADGGSEAGRGHGMAGLGQRQ